MSNTESYILFELAGTAYAVRSRDVLHIEMLEHITPVPNSAPWVEGVVFSRGQVIPAINLRVRFGLPNEARTARTRLVFIRHEERTIALIVDSAREFRSIATESIRPLGETALGISGHHVAGVATLNQQLVLVLDLPSVLRTAQAESAPLVAPLSN
ncbi:MAG TPA: chemotaxis protein CheW [Opitutaceae bacterium]|nr:chemotaxis protein CheW [Opitutaceae bacterium]